MNEATAGAGGKVYAPRRHSRTETLDIRGIACHLRRWGPEEGPLLVLLHGYRDSSATWQFMVDGMAKDWRIAAPDWRGYGHSGWAPHGYWHQDYLADLDILLERIAPREKVILISHSMGGNTANAYAGIRPERVEKVVAIDGFGLRNKPVSDLPDLLARWLKAWREPLAAPRGFATLDEMAARLIKANAKLDAPRALFLAGEMYRTLPDGSLAWSFDPAHARPFATLHRVDEWVASWSRITCPALWIGSGSLFPPSMEGDEMSFEWRMAQVSGVRFQRIEGTGHNVQHDAPGELARVIEAFLAE